MLPTSGFFTDIDCPYSKGVCGRPYCHFRHRKRNQETNDEQGRSAESEVPTYKPTPKSELASGKSHIPITYVPDLVIRSDRIKRPVPSFHLIDRPTYKPTPISLLANRENEYTPTNVQNDETDLSIEFQMIDELLQDVEKEEKPEYIPTIINKDKDRKDDLEEWSEETEECCKKKEEQHRKDKYSRSGDNKKNDKDRKDKQKKSDKEKPNTSDGEKVSDGERDKGNDRVKVKEKERVVHHKEKIREKDKRDRHKDDKKDSERGKRKNKEKDERDKRKDKVKEDSDKEKQKDKEKERRKDREKEEKEKRRNKEKEEERERRKEEDKEKKKEKDRRKEEKERRKEKEERRKEDKSKDRCKDNERDQKKTKERESSSKHKKSHRKHEHKKHSPLRTVDVKEMEDMLGYDSEEYSVEEECYKIFNEFKAPEKSESAVEPFKESQKDEDEIVSGKKRIAYEKAEQSSNKIFNSKPRSVPSVALAMTNRIKIARQKQAENEQTNLLKEIKQQGLKRTHNNPETVQPPKIVKLSKPVQKAPTEVPKSTNLIDDIINGRANAAAVKRRIAPVQNVNSMQQAKVRMIKHARLKAEAASKTAAQTINKGTKRVAHIPDASLSDVPDVLHIEKSKLPVNVRTRFLTLFVTECVKLYELKEDAYQRALNEECKVYERCNTLTTYRNSAMLGVNRLRKEAKEREESGLGLIQSGESTSEKNDSPFHGKAFYENIEQYILTEDELVLHGYPREGPTPGKAIVTTDRKIISSEHLDSTQRICCRCHKIYLVDEDGFALHLEDCFYHPLRKRTLRGEHIYLCCKSPEDTGCAMSNTHVSEISADRELEGYQSTMEPESENDPRSYAVYALDCEMCYTTKGLELTRVTIVDTNLKTVYETLVKPLNVIIDYNTRFSGITEEQMDRTSTSILQVQANILHLCNSKTILIGHSLESDMKALKIIHSTIVDTSVMFPHKFGLPHKRALRVLASEYLRKIIQNDVSGHDSAEDAITCMELVVWKVKENLKVKGIKR